ncbi:MAG: hypothetical protein JXR91_15915 [Deltaproteobacteria bacterium]|nr:hypothetical protein [Deltaproteobacteria bacterium]
MNKIIKLAIADFKIIFRDSSLKGFLFLPLVLFAFFIWFLPSMADKYEILKPYLVIFLVVGVIENTQTFCFITSMVLIDEKETGIAKAWGVVPLTKIEYFVSKFMIPCLFTFFVNTLFLQIQPFFKINLMFNILISFMAAMIVPLYVLGINSFATNRMQGLIYLKGFNMLVLLPVAAFFIHNNLRHLLGIIPTHWLFLTIENTAGQTQLFLPPAIGLLWTALLTWLVSKQFIKKHFQ